MLLALAGGGIAAWQWVGASASPGYVYETAAIERGTIERAISATGAVRARVTVDVSSQLSGQISEVLVDYNGPVKKGDLLARIDPRRFQARVRSAEAELAIARAGIAGQVGAVRKARAMLAQAERNAVRQEALAAKGTVSQFAIEDIRTKLEAARADLEIGEAQLANARALVAQREAALAEARLDLTNSEIRSPIDGVVIVRSVEPGQTVAASLQAPVLFRIAEDLSRIQIEAQVDEADIGQISTANRVTFTVDAYTEARFTGQVEQVRLAAIEAQNVVTYTVVIRAENPDRKLLPGMTATVRIVTGSREDALRAPNDAVRFRPPEAAMAGTREERRARAIERRVAQLTRTLGLDTDQQNALRDALRKIAAARADAGEADRGAGAEARRLAFDKALRKILTAPQMQRYAEIRARRQGTRGGTLWVLDANGRPQGRRVRLGLSDGTHTEIVRGKLQEGDRVIIRSRVGAPVARR